MSSAPPSDFKLRRRTSSTLKAPSDPSSSGLLVRRPSAAGIGLQSSPETSRAPSPIDSRGERGPPNESGSAEAIVVGMRLRPMVAYERGQKPCIKMQDQGLVQTVSVLTDALGDEERKTGPMEFAFDYAMDSSNRYSSQFVGQAKVYELMGARMLEHMLNGFNSCLFCYGQTGTGKTTTIMGEKMPASERGLLMRLLSELCDAAARKRESGSQVAMSVQMLEVYNEKINDLLAPIEQKDRKVDVHVHPKLGVYLKGVTESLVESLNDCLVVLDFGNNQKTVAATAMNSQSSRGHTIFKLIMKIKNPDGVEVSSEIYFADLAGRENERTTLVTGERKIELSFINSSLMWLATCISSLGEEANQRKRRNSIAVDKGKKKLDLTKFRNSKLTLLLSSTLTGNSRTSMIGTLSPAVKNFQESYTTLRFAATVKSIKLEAKASSEVNKETVIRNLQEEIQQLKDKLQKFNRGSFVTVEGQQEQVEMIKSELIAAEGFATIELQEHDFLARLSSSREASKKRGQGVLHSTLCIIIGKERAANSDEVAVADRCYQMISAHNQDESVMQNYVHCIHRAKQMIDQANIITGVIKPNSGLSFEMISQTPPFAVGYDNGVGGMLPEIGVRLMQKRSAPWTRWRWCYQQLKINGKIGNPFTGVMFGLSRLDAGILVSKEELRTGRLELIANWSWKKFLARLQLMQQVHACWAKEPEGFALNKLRDPWSPWGPGNKPSAEGVLEVELGKAVKRSIELSKEKALLAVRERHLEAEFLTLKQEMAESAQRERTLEAENLELKKEIKALRQGRQERVVRAALQNMQQAPVERRFGSCLEQCMENITLVGTLNKRLEEAAARRLSLKHRPLKENIDEALVGRAMHRDSSIVSAPLKDGDVYKENEFASKLWFSDVTADLSVLVQPHSDVGQHLEKAFGKPTLDLFVALKRRVVAYGELLRRKTGTNYRTNSAENIETLRNVILRDIWDMAKDVSVDKAFSKAETQLLPKLPLSLTKRLMKLFWELLPVVFYASAARFFDQDLAQRLAQAWQWMIQRIADKAKIENHSGLKGYQSEQWWYLLLCQATGNPGLQLGKFSHKAVDHAWYAKNIMGAQVKQKTIHTEIANLSDAAAHVRKLVPPMVAIVEAPCPKHEKDPITANLDMDAVGDANDSCCGAADALGLEHPTRLYTTPMLKASKQMIYFGGNDPEYSILYAPENRARGVSLVAEQGKTLTPTGKTIADSFSEWPVNKFEVEIGSVLAPVWILHAPSKEESKRDAAAESLGKNLEAFVNSFLPLPTNGVPSFVFADLNLYLFEGKHAKHFHTLFNKKRITCIRSKHFLTRKQVPLQDQLHKISEKDLDEVEPLRDSMYIMIRWPERMLAENEEEKAVWEALGLEDESSVGVLGFGVGGETSLSSMHEGSLQIWDDGTPDVIATDHTVVSVKGLRLSVFNMDNIRTKSFRVEKDPRTVQDAWNELGVPEMKLSKWHTSENFLYEITYAMWAHAALSILLELNIPVVRGQLGQIIRQDGLSES